METSCTSNLKEKLLLIEITSSREKDREFGNDLDKLTQLMIDDNNRINRDFFTYCNLFRISRDINPGINNFRDLDEPWFLLGAIGAFNGGLYLFILAFFV